jgi:hypothetical protein
VRQPFIQRLPLLTLFEKLGMTLAISAPAPVTWISHPHPQKEHVVKTSFIILLLHFSERKK